MENINLGDIAIAVGFLVALISGVGTLMGFFKKWIVKANADQLNEINARLDSLHSRINDVDLESCKNFLVQQISKIKWGSSLDEIEKQRFLEEYQHYINCGGNSYIKYEVETLTKEGKL